MAQIGNYYTVVGLQIDPNAIRRLDKYLGQIRGRLTTLQRSVSSAANIQVSARLDVNKTTESLTRGLRQASKNVSLNVNSLKIDGEKAKLDIRTQLGAVDIDARISRGSLDRIKQQLNAQSSVSMDVKRLPIATVQPVVGPSGRPSVGKAKAGQDVPAWYQRVRRSESRLRELKREHGLDRGILGALGTVAGAKYFIPRMMHPFQTFAYERARAAGRPFVGSERFITGRGSIWRRASGDAARGLAGGVGGRRPGEGWDKTRRVSPHSRRNFNPWYNPMLVGGSLGAFMRYGAYSLPFVAGTMGTSSMANRAAEVQNARDILKVALGGDQEGARHYSFLTQLGERLGFGAIDVARPYSKWVSSSRGSSFERRSEE